MDRLQRVNGSREEGVGAFLEGAFLGGFSGNDSWSTVVGSTAVGFIPVVGQIADIRDLAAAVMHVAEGEEGAWLELGASTLGVVPGLDFAKGMAKGATRAGREALEEVVTRGAVELADDIPNPGKALAAASSGSGRILPWSSKRVSTAADALKRGSEKSPCKGVMKPASYSSACITAKDS